ncbi:Phosphoenolpyruvate/pyruvate domain-containing protein [Mollisia scopiformis]|uniref:Phosphoenolpyruvate/pyruvate domain-containing protein n=1 Tax=Mollisia scopiformis TaxID=149040 RepID=A0A132B5L6_MOLSC|nr:Phosphoenolpyruvate/pyruvate domain-containing protein [Mollisia scopiformis]KUJ07700.1 Phosphoenolpyruvate/pyruvate domain-containing protein [Mollisia scopiformis]
MSSQNARATYLRQLHIPGKPILLTNIYDAMSARAIAALPGTKALATASYAIAGAAGVTDDGMTLETNLAAVHGISGVAKEYGLPLTVDWQDGYGARLEEGIQDILKLGVVEINLEDCDKETQKMLPVEVAAERVKRVLATAEAIGVADIVVNARTDTLIHNGTVSEAIERGKAYLAAGATTVFVWGGSIRGGITREEVKLLVDAFNGKLNVSMKMGEGNLTAKELARMGVAGISIGPALQFIAMKIFGEEAENLIAST